MDLTFIDTHEFARLAEGVFTDEELRQVELLLMANPNARVVIPGTGAIHLLPLGSAVAALLPHALPEESTGDLVRGQEGAKVMSKRQVDTEFEDSLLRGMEEMLAHQRGEIQLRTRAVKVEPLEQAGSAPPAYDGARVRALRAKLSLSPQHSLLP